MIVVYVAGPYSAPDSWQRERNIREAEEIALALACNRDYPVAVICVHTMSRFAFGHVPEEQAIAADDELLIRSDAVVLAPRWGKSTGTCNEIRLAHQHDIPVFTEIEDFYKWAFLGLVTTVVVPGLGPNFAFQGIGPLRVKGDRGLTRTHA